MARTAVLGFPRIGRRARAEARARGHWAGRCSADALLGVAQRIRAAQLQRALDAGIDVIPVGDHALYDHVLDTAEMAGIVAERHRGEGLEAHFRAARGAAGTRPLELTKWFDTNYHYLVPELDEDQAFRLDPGKWLAHLEQGRTLGAPSRPVVFGPFSLLLLAKGGDEPLRLLPALSAVYAELLEVLGSAGAQEVQLDEPCLVLDRSEAELDAFADAYGRLVADATPDVYAWRPTSTSCPARRSRGSRASPPPSCISIWCGHPSS